MNLSPLSRALLRAGTCAASLAVATAVLASESTVAQPQPVTVPQAEGEPETASGSAKVSDGAAPQAADGEIVVSAGRLKGQLVVDQAPLLELGETEIAAEGVTSITDLIAQISARTGSARGRGGGGQCHGQVRRPGVAEPARHAQRQVFAVELPCPARQPAAA